MAHPGRMILKPVCGDGPGAVVGQDGVVVAASEAGQLDPGGNGRNQLAEVSPPSGVERVGSTVAAAFRDAC